MAGYEPGDSYVVPAAGAAVPRRGRRRPRAAADRASRPSRRSTCRSTPACAAAARAAGRAPRRARPRRRRGDAAVALGRAARPVHADLADDPGARTRRRRRRCSSRSTAALADGGARDERAGVPAGGRRAAGARAPDGRVLARRRPRADADARPAAGAGRLARRGDGDPWSQFRRSAQFTPFTPIVNVTGQPAMSVPLHWTRRRAADRRAAHRAPGGRGDAAARARAQLEHARPWAARRPTVEVSVPPVGARITP